MRRSGLMIMIALVFLMLVGIAVAKKNISPDTYMGKSPEEAADALLNAARIMAENGSWENIHVARVYFLAGRKEEGQAILDQVLSRKAEAGDWLRVGRVYYQAGEWDKARSAFDKVLAMKPKDEDWLAEIGAYHNLQGAREKAEELFQRSFSLDSDSLKNTLTAAGSYVGVTPRKR